MRIYVLISPYPLDHRAPLRESPPTPSGVSYAVLLVDVDHRGDPLRRQRLSDHVDVCVCVASGSAMPGREVTQRRPAGEFLTSTCLEFHGGRLVGDQAGRRLAGMSPLLSVDGNTGGRSALGGGRVKQRNQPLRYSLKWSFCGVSTDSL